MKERPILFSAEMVRAIRARHKTQTRRAIKPQPPLGSIAVLSVAQDWKGYEFVDRSCIVQLRPRNPYGVPGDRLWVRETHFLEARDSGGFDQWSGEHDEWQENTGRIWYAADGVPPEPCKYGWWEKRSSIHMFREDSRILLEIIGVRAEQVQDISHEDAKAEGLLCYHENYQCALDDFPALWDSINAKRRYKEWLCEPFGLWCWGRDEHDDPESVCLDICSPGDILWRECETDAWIRFGKKAPPCDGYYFVIWEPGDAQRKVYLSSTEPVEGEDYILRDYSWASNPWVWVVEFRALEK